MRSILQRPAGQFDVGTEPGPDPTWSGPLLVGARLSDCGRPVRSTGERPPSRAPARNEGDDADAAPAASRTPPVRPDRADLVGQLLLRGAQRVDGGARLQQLLGRLLRRTICAVGRVPAEVVHAAFYSFADGEAARHIPKVWDTTTPEAAHAARERGCVAALRRILGDLVETPGSHAPPTCWPRPRSVLRPRDGSCTPGSARSRFRRSSGWPGSGIRPTCCVSTAGTATSSRWSPSGSVGPRPTC